MSTEKIVCDCGCVVIQHYEETGDAEDLTLEMHLAGNEVISQCNDHELDMRKAQAKLTNMGW